MEDWFEPQMRMLAALTTLTAQGRAVWLKRNADPEWASCFVGNEHFLFKATYVGRDEDFVPDLAVDEPDGILMEARNRSFPWLQGVEGWNDVLSLIRKAIVDHEQYAWLLQSSVDAMVTQLESLVEGSGEGQ